jgi:hypothetical protein
MPTRRAIKSVLHDFLGTYTSRYSEYDGYWLFGFMVESLDRAEFDLFKADCNSLDTFDEFARQVAVARFTDQLRKSKLERSRVREARLLIKRLPNTIIAQVNGRPSNGHGVRFEVAAVTDTGRRFEAAKTIFVAPHNPHVEIRSSRWNENPTCPDSFLE